MFYFTYYLSPLGKLLLVGDEAHLTGVWFEKQKYYASTAPEQMLKNDDLPIFTEIKKWLDAYFRGQQLPIADLPLAPQGSEFRQMVWQILCQIPYGKVMTYGEIARKIAQQTSKSTISAQAVGGAVGHNPISIIIPCHRVVGSNGSLTGYAGGLETKLKLLKLENADLSRLFYPKKRSCL